MQDFILLEKETQIEGNLAEVALSSGEYFWRVQAQDSQGRSSPWSDPEKISVDDSKPAATAATRPAPAQGNDQRYEYYRLEAGKKLILRFESYDEQSGPGKIYARINENEFSEIPSGYLELRRAGSYRIEWYALDQAGNRSSAHVRFILIDTADASANYE